MGYCDSPTKLSGHTDVFSTDGRVAAIDSKYRYHGPSDGIGPLARAAGRWILLALIRCYQVFLGPFLGGACKFHPSCSNYAHEAVVRHGAGRGALLALKRLGRCRPFTKGGFDPVPEAQDESACGQASPVSVRTHTKELRQ